MNKHQTHDQSVLHISGAGPTGLAAAITCARAGAKVVVHERQQALGGRMRAGIVNRFMFSRLGDRGYSRLLSGLATCRDIRSWLMRFHREHWYTHLLFPWANWSLASKRKDFSCTHQNCTCTWYRCSKGVSYA